MADVTLPAVVRGAVAPQEILREGSRQLAGYTNGQMTTTEIKSRFIGLLTRDGGRDRAARVFAEALDELRIREGEDIPAVLHRAIENVAADANLLKETRRIAGEEYVVPRMGTNTERATRAIHRIMTAARAVRRGSMATRLAAAIMTACHGKLPSPGPGEA